MNIAYPFSKNLKETAAEVVRKIGDARAVGF